MWTKLRYICLLLKHLFFSTYLLYFFLIRLNYTYVHYVPSIYYKYEYLITFCLIIYYPLTIRRFSFSENNVIKFENGKSKRLIHRVI